MNGIGIRKPNNARLGIVGGLSILGLEFAAWDTYNGLLGAALAAPDWFAVANAYESLRGLDGFRAIDSTICPTRTRGGKQSELPLRTCVLASTL